MSERQIDRSAWILPWAAGVVDSDGCITIKRTTPDKYGVRYYSLHIIVAQCNDHSIAPVIKVLQDAFGGSVSRRQPKGRRTMWHWTVAHATAAIFLEKLQPYLIGKQDQAQAALEYRSVAVGQGKEKRVLGESYYRKLRAFKNYKQVSQTGEQIP